ncbi:uncharacterized protein [Physcomitrium patens]|uniref:NOG1 n=2 Tax=Physcomitrium patens TaxID=3218 RepID=A9SZ24_PHYPA|nr:uncharacterized protein LOC112285363 [Physcomitrium patens]AVH79720.1 NOG1 [Physcomitrium patens]PNR62103.1 hypothetical protein PHYPA_000527 [Physcomitrium patens]|eukprot:XP_024381917.1 uncharacterized protein LOC112285363 [Physcomitrella patens]
MEYDYGRSGHGSGGYEMGRPMYHSRQGSNVQGSYPRVGQSAGDALMNRGPPQAPLLSVPSFPSGSAIKVTIKPMYRLGPPAQLRVQSREVPRSLFQFEFDLERRILAEAEQGNLNFRAGSGATLSQSNSEADLAEVEDATVAKYLAMGHNKEAVQYALQTYGDDQNKVLDFCPPFNRIREMGFAADRVAKALASCNNDEEQAISSLVS